MSNKPSLLARVFGRSKHPVVSSLATAVLNRPLLAHTAMAEAMIGAYLTGDVTSADTQLSAEVIDIAAASPQLAADTVARLGVINISGGLVNRPMPGPSGGGPVSYTAVRDAFDTLLEDDQVTHIVLRIESPGGMASGLFDLADYIHASRGQKPIIALVDDHAYSAAYAIAAACEQVWVSRTGGTGSIGVCAFHYDWSGNAEQVGLKVTAIYAGDNKVDFNPHFALSDEAKARAQGDVDVLYDMFVSAIASYRGIEAAAVRGTQALTYQGQLGIDAGLATHLGTWDDLVASINAPGADAPEQPGDADAESDEAAAVAPVEIAAAERPVVASELSEDQARMLARGAMAEAAAAAKLAPELTAALIAAAPECSDIPARIAHATKVVGFCNTAGKPELAGQFIKAFIDIDEVRTDLLAAKATAEAATDVVTTLPALAGSPQAAPCRLDPKAIYHKRGN